MRGFQNNITHAMIMHQNNSMHLIMMMIGGVHIGHRLSCSMEGISNQYSRSDNFSFDSHIRLVEVPNTPSKCEKSVIPFDDGPPG